MENNQAENLSSSDSIESSVKTQSIDKVTSLLSELLYPSESDEPIEWFSFKSNLSYPLTISDLKFFQGHAPDVFGEEILIENFWSPLVIGEEWHDEYENEQIQIGILLRQHVESLLTHFQAFRIGQVEVDLYLVGQLDEGEWAGLKTKLIQTD